MKSKNFNDYSIKTKILAMSIIQILLPVLLIGILSFVLSNSIIRTQTFSQTKLVFSFVSQKLTDYANNIFDTSQEFLYDRDIYDTIAFDLPSDSAKSQSIISLMDKIVTSNAEIDAVSLTIGDRNFRTTQKKNDIWEMGSVGYIQAKKLAAQRSDSVYWYTNSDASGIDNIFFARLIYNPYTYKEAGMIIFQVSPDIFTDTMQKYNNTLGKNFDVISPLNQYIFKSAHSEISPIELSLLPIEQNKMFKHNDVYLIYQNIPSLNWNILCVLDSGKMFDSSHRLMICIFLLCLLSTLLLAVFTRYINLNICYPLHNLANNMKHWEERKIFDNSCPGRQDEIGVLYENFSSMTDQIDTLINQNYKSQILAKDAELKMLQSQISPHFLFNTLSAINNLALLNDIPQIGEMVTALSDILNQSIGRDGSFLPLIQELSYADSYIYIQNVRFNGKFHVVKELAEETKNICIPCLTLQPIIENAVKHGLASSQHECVLNIKSVISDGDMIVTISDNGAGIDHDRLDEMNKAFSDNVSSINGSVGLANVNKRLTLLYGNEYHLAISSEKNIYTAVTVRYKLNLNKE